MSADYVDCEARIRDKVEEICKMDCAFFNMCTKRQKSVPVFDFDATLELAFELIK